METLGAFPRCKSDGDGGPSVESGVALARSAEQVGIALIPTDESSVFGGVIVRRVLVVAALRSACVLASTLTRARLCAPCAGRSCTLDIERAPCFP